jgi:hypothetical protein
MKLAFDEAAEKRRRGRAIETMVVIKNSHPHAEISPRKTC